MLCRPPALLPTSALSATPPKQNKTCRAPSRPQVILSSLFTSPDDGVALQLYISANNTVALFVIASVTYGIGACAVGQLPRLPLVADAADSQVRGGDW